MIVVDMESSGLDPMKHSLLSIGAVDFGDPSRTFYVECRVWDGAHIDSEALKINGFTEESAHDSNKLSDREAVEQFLIWADQSAEHTIAGQNPSVDRDFLMHTARRYHINWPMAHRVIDLHSICHFHMLKCGLLPPVENGRSNLNLDKILNYVGLPDEERPHNGLRGAKLEAEAFWRLFYDKGLFDEYSHFPVINHSLGQISTI